MSVLPSGGTSTRSFGCSGSSGAAEALRSSVAGSTGSGSCRCGSLIVRGCPAHLSGARAGLVEVGTPGAGRAGQKVVIARGRFEPVTRMSIAEIASTGIAVAATRPFASPASEVQVATVEVVPVSVVTTSE